MRRIIVFATVLGLATAAHAAATPAQKCQAGKNQEAGKYSSCLHKAEAKLLTTAGSCSLTPATECYADSGCGVGETCVKDLTKFNATVDKCEEKFAAKWTSLEEKAGGSCPDGLLPEEVKEALDESVANIAAGLAGDGLSSCGGELVTCEGDLTTCESDLGTTETELVTCEGDLTTCDSDLTVCDTDLTTCEGDLVVALDCGDGGIDAGEDCDLGNLNGGTCAGEGFAGGVLRCGAGCVYDTSECYAARFVDNANGTITDNDTGLTWEKKVKLDSTLDLANRQDADNSYRWSGNCSVTTSKRCQPDAASEAACLAGVEGDPLGCAQCTGGEGTCTVTPNGTIWQVVAALNTANYGGHNDWRVPTRLELEGILDLSDTTPPTVNSAFAGASCGAACTDVNNPACSCTQSNFYWSASTYGPNPFNAWIVYFYDGYVNADTKTRYNYVRAVRGGS